jgi:hypothetical protein
MTARVSVFVCLALVFAGTATAQSTPNQIHTSPQQDPGVYSGRLKVDYPTPYELATIDDIRKTLEHVHAYVEQAAPVQISPGCRRRWRWRAPTCRS